MENASEKMTKEELLDLFSKYDLVELTAMNTVLNYAKDVDTVEAQTAIRKVFYDADDEVIEDYGLFMRHYTPSMSMINKKSDLLTKKEAKYLLELVDSANKYLESVELFEPDVCVESDLLELDKVRDSLNKKMENKTSAINIQVDSNVKKEATDVLTELGLSMSSAINLFLKQVVKKNGIPFEITNVSPKKKILDVVCGLIMKDGKCLIAQRKKEDHLYGKWEFPGGRRVGLEDEKKTLDRAFTEVLGINTKINDYITHSICEYPGHIVDLKLYECDYISGDFKLNIHSDYKWVAIEELLDYDLADADVILTKFLIKKYIEEAKENNK